MLALARRSRPLLTSSRMVPVLIDRQGRLFSSVADEFVKTDIDEGRGVATLTMNRPPVNSLSLEMLEAISSAVRTVERECPKVQGLVLSSSNPAIFSAGLDITEIHNPDPDRLPEFWGSFQQAFIDLYGSRLSCIAAIEGHAPAAGCMLALCCDYRIMAGSEGAGSKGSPMIGLNETKLGIVAPSWLGTLMARTIGHREAEKALALGILYTPQEALGIGLVDEVVPADDVLEKSVIEATKWAMIPPQARIASKLLLRKEPLDHLKSTRKEDMDSFCSFVRSDSAQANVKKYLENLRKKKKQ